MPFIKVNVDFDIDIVVDHGLTLSDCIKKIKANPEKYGVIFNTIKDVNLGALNLPSGISDLIKEANAEFARYENSSKGEAQRYGSVYDNKKISPVLT